MSLPLDLACRRQGEGPPVLILHGLLGSGRNWGAVATALADRHEVILPDLRNHGGSPWSEAMSYPLMAADLAALLDRLGLASAAVIGHSMGGKAAMTLALTAPERVRRLCIVDIAPVAYPPGLETYVAAMQAIDPARLARRAEADAALAPAVPDPGIRAFLLQNLETRDGRLAWRPNLAALATAMPIIRGFPAPPSDTAPYAGPTLVVRGERSDYVLPEHEPAIRRLFPKAELRTVQGAGHWVHAERPQDFLATLRPWLES